MESEEEEGVGKTGDTIEEGEELIEIYQDTVKEEGNTEEDSKEEEKEGNVESKTEVIQHAGVTCRRQTGTR